METKPDLHTDDLYLVGVGASAGGLDALTKFLANLNGTDDRFSVVVAMHLSPDHKSELSAILAKRCKWPVVTVNKKQRIAPRHIYITPQNKNVVINENTLELEPLPVNHTTSPNIDVFFNSLAINKRKKAIGIILSGYGSDGSKGIVAIKEQKGFTMAQLPESAEHKDMPLSAIRTSAVDRILPAEEMYEEILLFIENSRALEANPARNKKIEAIFELLEKRSGTNLALYKQSTILRRINHRMNSLQLSSLGDYYNLIRESPQELDQLFDSVLIGVTEFFRDAPAFESLHEELERIVSEKRRGDSIRAWSIGCASGEEAYSLAILLYELLGESVNKYHVQVFASDLDEKALNFARKGRYHKDRLVNLPEHLIHKYFTEKEKDYFQVSKEIKQHLLFTRHDITNDPPFVKIDVIICRNLLIYFNNYLQKQVLQVMHYSLRRKGILFMGKSESVSVTPQLFTKITQYKIFEKAEANLNYPLKFSRYRNKAISRKSRSAATTDSRNMSLHELIKETLYQKYEHPFVVINDEAEVREVHGSLRLYMEMNQGAINTNLFKMANEELVTTIKVLSSQVKKTGVPHTSQVLKFSLYDTMHYVRIKIIPLLLSMDKTEYQLVSFEKIDPDSHHVVMQRRIETSDLVDVRIGELEDELATSREHLQILTEELEAANEELQIINEELQSANEELKSSNEELETSNEELQSSNEELNTANSELRLNNEALAAQEEELQEAKLKAEHNELLYRRIAENIPNGTVGLLNENFEIGFIAGKTLNSVHGLKAEDLIGKNFVQMNPSEKERKKLMRVFTDTLNGKAGNIEFGYNERIYELQTVPIVLPESNKTSIMYLIQDITEERKNDVKFKMAVDAASLVFYEYNYKTDTIVRNEGLLELFEVPEGAKFTRTELVEKFHEVDKQRIQEIRERSLKSGIIDEEIRIVVGSGIKWIRLTGRVIFDENKNPDYAVATMLDITKDKNQLARIREREERFRSIADGAPVKIWIADAKGNKTYFNRKWLEFSGRSLEEDSGMGWLELVHPDDVQECRGIYENAVIQGKPYTMEYRARKNGAGYRWILDSGLPVRNATEEIESFIGSCVDITHQREFTMMMEEQVKERTRQLSKSNEELRRLNENLEDYAHAASHDLQEPLRKIETFSSIIKDNLNDPERSKRFIAKIETSARRMRRLVQDILAYNELNGSRQKFEKVDLGKVIREIEKDFELIIREKNAELDYSRPGKVLGSPIQIYQLLANLIKNALTYNNGRPEIQIRSKLVTADQLPERYRENAKGKYNRIDILDNGIGFDLHHLDKLMKPFGRLHANSEYPGSGIGLATCKKILDLHNGFLEVKSKKGEGSVFTIYLPQKQEEVEQES